MKRNFLVEIETDGVCMSDASDIQLALVRYFVSGVRISVKESTQHNVHPTGCTCPRFENGSKVFPMRECAGCREPASG